MAVYTKKQVQRSYIFVGLSGGELRCISEDGELKWDLGLPPGRHFGDANAGNFMGPTDVLEVTGAVHIVKAGGKRIKVQRHPSAFESGANPDYQPTIASQAQQQMQRQLNQLAANMQAAERRAQSSQRVLETVLRQQSQQPQPRQQEVIEDETQSDQQAQPDTASPQTASEAADSPPL